ncbi:STAS domain-containing protein [Marinactinospora thermotolerans]|uniref:Anti-sigma factor antagonist n=1 Tax=Marinactinospora thermotolerans DSM 45154 TaxID=1122192 RepID=A0A1T4R8Z1_9ACTN|nr:STAS domain-containing protein [Marinactinospora thermotolerans]SKA12286.1 anti-anti-sigma factor [Marinactinospora thermotolerans DSM 45154]
MNSLSVAVEDAPTGPVVQVMGDLDYDSADVFRAAVGGLAVPPGALLVIDLAGLTFCDSSGITAFLAAWNHARASGGDAALAAVPPSTARILHIVGVDRILQVYPDATVAAQAASRGA